MKNPEAWIAVNKNRVRHYRSETDKRARTGNEGVTWLEDLTEFQIELFNPTQHTVLAKIKVNGKSIGKGGLVLRPGERTFLERFLGKKKKFKFTSYDVEDTDEVRMAITNNGLVEVKWYKEVELPGPTWGITNTGNTGTWTSGTHDWGCGSSVPCSNLTIQPSGITYTSNTSGTFLGATTSNTAQYSGVIVPPVVCSSAPETMKTGRVEEGSKSAQNFMQVDSTFEAALLAFDRIRVLPIENMAYTTDEAVRNYCTECGRRLKKNWNFCAGCGCEC